MYNIIKGLCRERGITIATMCRECGIAQTTMSELRHGRTKCLSAPVLQKIADYFGVTMATLLGEEHGAPVLSAEMEQYLDMLRKRPGLRALLKVHEGSTDEEIEANVRFIEQMRKK